MLRELAIRNFAIIEDLRISLSGGLTILSGETGAGKSILINAVQLLLGGRVSPGLIRSGAETAELEACFDIDPGSPSALRLIADGFTPEEGLLVRRVISRQERHRTYVNGRLATIAQLASLSEGLASIAGQHAHQGLLREELHLLVLDQFGRLLPLREESAACHRRLVPLIRQLETLEQQKAVQAEQLDLLDCQRREIEAAQIAPDEDTLLLQERHRLRNAEALYTRILESIEALYGGAGAITERLGEIRRNLEKARQMDPQLERPLARLGDLTFALEDTVGELSLIQRGLQIDPQRLEWVESRLDLLQKIKRKYGGSLDEVCARLDALGKELVRYNQVDETIRHTRQELDQTHAQLVALAERLSAKRHQAAAELAARGETELADLEMAGTRFTVELQPNPSDEQHSPYLVSRGRLIGEAGWDRARFMIAPNIGEPLKPLAIIASGGELSRVVLALKAILADVESLSTVVFDEVDAGIGGRVAEGVGRKLAALARCQQIICITHLPQIAKFADHHFRITKSVAQGRTSATIAPLNDTERVAEIARMLGGETITRKTLDHAAEMLKKDHTPAVGRAKRTTHGV